MGAGRSSRRRSGLGGGEGFTLPEMLIGLVIVGIAAAFSTTGFATYRETTATTRAARAIMTDVAMARSLAIRTRAPVSLVSRDTARTYVIRDTLGNILHRRDLSQNSEIPLSSLDVATTGDSLTFDSRGILVTAGTVQIDIVRGSKTKTVIFNAMGRALIY